RPPVRVCRGRARERSGSDRESVTGPGPGRPDGVDPAHGCADRRGGGRNGTRLRRRRPGRAPRRAPPEPGERPRRRTMTDPADLSALRAATVIAVLRAPSAAAAVAATDALVAGGVTGIEITYSTPDAPAAIREARQRHGDAVYLGAGTVLTEDHAAEAVAAGAEFLVSPGTDPMLTRTMISTGMT